MHCEKCGQSMLVESQKDPWCMYQIKDGKVINKLFHPDAIPDGWFDSPKAAKAATTEPQVEVKRGPGRPKKVIDDNSSGFNQLVS